MAPIFLFREASKYLLFLLLLFVSLAAQAQAEFLTATNDTLKAEEYGYFSIPEIDYEIKKTNNFLDKTALNLIIINEELDKDTTYVAFFHQIELGANDFNSYDPNNLSKFFLDNNSRIWTSYKRRLYAIHDRSFDFLSTSEKLNQELKKYAKTWEKTRENAKKIRIPEVQKDKIRTIQNRINKQNDENYEFSLRIINSEIAISQQIAFVEDMLQEIRQLQNNYRSLLLQREVNAIWNIQLKDTTNRSFYAAIKLAWYDNTKYIRKNYAIYSDNFTTYSLVVLLLFVFHLFLVRKYSKSFGDTRKTIVGDLRYVVLSAPIGAYFAAAIFLFFFIFDNMPLGITNFAIILMVLSIYISIGKHLKKEERKIIIITFLLTLINYFEILAWYMGDYARLYLLFESSMGIILTYPFITKKFKIDILPHLKSKKTIDLIRYPIFSIFVISFFANIFGYLHLCIFLESVGVHILFLIIAIIGLWHIFNGYTILSIDILSRMKSLGVNNQLELLRKRSTQLFHLYFIYVFFNYFLNLFGYKNIFYSWLYDAFLDTRELGSISFRYWDIMLFFILLTITWALISLVKIIFDEENFRKYSSWRGIPSAISMTLRILFASVGLFFAFSAAGFDMDKLSIIVGALGVGIGFGLQNIVNNYISGLILIYERPVQKGDTVEVNNLVGEVVDIGIRRSNVRTFDGAEVIIPNANLTSNQLINWTLSDKHKRLDITIGVSYGANPNKVMKVLQDIIDHYPLIVNNPSPRVLFHEFGESSVNFRILAWVLFENGITARSEIGIAIFNALAENKIEIPFPQMDIHIKEPKGDKKVTIKQEEKPPAHEKLIDDDGGDE
ncbi:MAG: hypothetical protein B7C24_09920 [Bacteroidetes bacterium 4572_77]|nr:MAG: hypothetical protein B7C24_09920 [Bacteroidetes bacterium 4572_77]